MSMYIYILAEQRTQYTLPIITLAGTAFHSSQNVINEDVTRIIPGIKTVVK